MVQSPFLNVYYKHHPIKLTIDTGAATNMVIAALAKSIGLHLASASQLAHQADGITPLEVIGEVHCDLTNLHTFNLNVLVVKHLDVEILAGNPFLETNDIAARPAKCQIVIAGSEVVQYGPEICRPPSVRRIQASFLSS